MSTEKKRKEGTGHGVDLQDRQKVEPPKKYKVILHNDDFTPMELVIDILKAVFKHDEESAKKKTLEVHNHGAAVVGQYVFEIAEQKALEATKIARINGSPLKLTLEEQSG